MKYKKAWRWIALLALSAMLAGCTDVDTTQPNNAAQEETQTQATQTEDEKQQMSEGQLSNMVLEELNVDPMNLKDTWQRAAFFADWVYAEKRENVLVSPLSLNMALGLVAEGASGDTAKELYDYLGRTDYTSYVDQYLEFAEGLACKKGEKQYNDSYSFRYEIANSLWVNQNNRLLKDYQKTVQKAFRAEVEPADFEKDVSGTVKKINSWCSDKTHKLIPKIVETSDISPDLKAILINSLYFESPWKQEWHVSEGEFTAMDGSKKTQDMLYGSVDCYYENDKATAFGKAYSNGFCFIGILPKEKGEFSILNLDLESLMKSESYDYLVSARMPKLNYGTTESNVEKILQAQGMELPFTFNAEIKGIIENNNLYINQIIQKTKIELDENGTKAAAVTAIMMKASGMMPQQEVKEVILDRPFAFMIYDTQNDEILFLGKVTQSAE